MIRFRFNPRKAMQAIGWMLSETGAPLDFHTILKAVYFSDKEMLKTHGRPIFGAGYRAMNYGPVPLEVYEMLKCEPYWLSELGNDEYPWQRTGFRVARDPGRNAAPDTDDISEIELECLMRNFQKCRQMTFDQRTRETHGMDWVEGTRRDRGRMAYEDMIDPDLPGREELIEDLEAMGPRLVL